MKNKNIDLVELTKDKSFESIQYITIKGVTLHNTAFKNKNDEMQISTLHSFVADSKKFHKSDK
jgi:hypothetical protein